MAHNDAPHSKTIKLTREEDMNGEKTIDNGRSVADTKGESWQKYYHFHINPMYCLVFSNVELTLSVFS